MERAPSASSTSREPSSRSALYGGIGIEAQIRFSIEMWIKIKLIFKTIKLSFRFSLTIGFTASLEAGILGLSLPALAQQQLGHGVILSHGPWDPRGGAAGVQRERGAGRVRTRPG